MRKDPYFIKIGSSFLKEFGGAKKEVRKEEDFSKDWNPKQEGFKRGSNWIGLEG